MQSYVNFAEVTCFIASEFNGFITDTFFMTLYSRTLSLFDTIKKRKRLVFSNVRFHLTFC